MAHDITVGATRGRRMDEALTALRPLVAGSEVTMSGDFFTLDRVRILPPPAVPIVIGGRSDAALRRVARHGDGWLGCGSRRGVTRTRPGGSAGTRPTRAGR